MSGVMVSVATGVMTSVIDKLTSLLGNEYRLATDVRRGIRFMRDELSSMNAALLRLAEVDDDLIDVQAKEWRSKVRELSYDIEDCVDRFMLVHSSRKAQDSMVQSMVRKIKELWEDYKIATEIRELKALVVEEKERRDRYNIDQNLAMPQQVLLDPRAPTMYEDAMDLVGIDSPRQKLISLLMDEEKQLKVVSIYGIGGQGKTTLAMEVYREIGGQFDCFASVTVSRAPDIPNLLRDLLFQISRSDYDNSEKWGNQQLIPTLRKYLMDKRYLIIIDDIWDVLAWEHVKVSLPGNNYRSRIITTTRNRDVARSCITGGHKGRIYKARPLGKRDSRKLFFRRTFGIGEECPKELQEIADDILRKCGGLPLAIICIAGLLARKSQTVEAWVQIRKSVSSTTETAPSIDKLTKILFLSYYDLPQNLKSCFLYLSVFPEDYEIHCQQLIWTWVAEGLIPGYNRESMEQQGESCLNELISRSMIKPTRMGADGRTVKYCSVHDVIHDFIVTKAVEDNFVAVWNYENLGGNFSNKSRRLSIHLGRGGRIVDHFDNAMKDISRIRSLNIFGSQNEWVMMDTKELRNNQVLRVLNIDSRIMLPLTEVVSKKQLSYLRMNFTIDKFPEEIGKLQHLETLDVRNTTITVLPESIVQMQKLVRLFVPPTCVLPDRIGNLKALEELLYCAFSKESAKCIQGMVDLTKLKVLKFLVCSSSAEVKEACISSLSKLLMHLRTLCITGPEREIDPDFAFPLIASGTWTPPLQRLNLLGPILHSIPCEISSLVHLTYLKFDILGGVSKEGLNILASLPMLLSLSVVILYDEGMDHTRHVIGKQGFERLEIFKFEAFHDASLEFEPEAMPNLQRLRLDLKSSPHQFMYGPGGVLLGLQNLSSLRYIKFMVNCSLALDKSKEDTLEYNIRDQVAAHPKRPILDFKKEYPVSWVERIDDIGGFTRSTEYTISDLHQSRDTA